MSQAGELNVVQNHPDIPTLFIANVGSATPLANELEILGSGIITTTGAGNTITISATSTAPETLTGNSGGPVPATANNINTIGSGSITVVGSPGTSTLTTQLTGLTQHSLQVGGTAGTLTQLGVATNGQLPIGSTGADPVLATLTAGTGISISNGAGSISISTSSTGTVNTLTGNSGGPISPTGGNINTIGAGSITIAGSGSTLTTQLTGITNHAIQIGSSTSTLTQLAATVTTGQILQNNASADPSWSTATYPSTTTINQLLYSSSANVVAGLATANRAVLTTGTTGIPALTALATDGQLIIGSTAGAPAAATLTAGTGITITNASNSITIAVTTGTGVVETLTGNSGGAISPTAGNINTLGTGSITIAGSGSTLTTQLTGLTNHNVLVGAGTTTITNVAPSATSGVPLISQGAASDPVFGTALVAGGGTASTSFNITGVVISGATSTTALTSVTLTDGQLAIGSSTGNPAAATLTAGTGITITNGHNSITVASTGGGITWSETSGTFTAASNHGYFITAASTPTLPASPSEGDVVAFAVDTASACTVTGNTGQKIRIGAALSASAGTAANNARGDTLHLVYESTGTTWWATATMGTWTIT